MFSFRQRNYIESSLTHWEHPASRLLTERVELPFCIDGSWASGVRVGRDGSGLSQVWERQIQQLNRVSPSVACAVTAAYPSPQLLLQVTTPHHTPPPTTCACFKVARILKKKLLLAKTYSRSLMIPFFSSWFFYSLRIKAPVYNLLEKTCSFSLLLKVMLCLANITEKKEKKTTRWSRGGGTIT